MSASVDWPPCISQTNANGRGALISQMRAVVSGVAATMSMSLATAPVATMVAMAIINNRNSNFFKVPSLSFKFFVCRRPTAVNQCSPRTDCDVEVKELSSVYTLTYFLAGINQSIGLAKNDKIGYNRIN